MKWLGYKHDDDKQEQPDEEEKEEEEQTAADNMEVIWKKDTDRLNFDWIERTGPKILSLVDDLNELAYRNGFFNHEIDQQVKEELDELYDQHKNIIKVLDNKAKNFGKESVQDEDDNQENADDSKQAIEVEEKSEPQKSA